MLPIRNNKHLKRDKLLELAKTKISNLRKQMQSEMQRPTFLTGNRELIEEDSDSLMSSFDRKDMTPSYLAKSPLSNFGNSKDYIIKNVNKIISDVQKQETKEISERQSRLLKRKVSELSTPRGYYDSDDQIDFEKSKKHANLKIKVEKALENPEFSHFAKNKIKDFEKYAEQIQKLSYVQCKESLIDYITNKSIYRKTIDEKNKDPYELRKAKNKKKVKLTLLERPSEDDNKFEQKYAKTGEIRLRDLSPGMMRHKRLRMKNYGRWYVQPQNFNDIMKNSKEMRYIL